MADVRIVDVAGTPSEEFRRWDIDGFQVNTHLAGFASTGTPDVVVDAMVFPPGFVHHMHRHPHADQLMYILSGSVVFYGSNHRGVDVRDGQLLVVPRGTWHEVRNESEHPCSVLHIFAGVGSTADIGYEAFDATRVPPASSVSASRTEPAQPIE